MITKRELEQEIQVELAPAFGRALQRTRPEKKATARNAAPYLVIDRFPFNQARLLSIHLPKIDRVARRIALSWPSGVPIREVRLVGHADNTGRAQYNLRLGQQRAEAVKAGLIAALARIAPGSTASTRIVADTLGASWPAFDKSNASAEGRSRNRRVEVFLVRPRPPRTAEASRAIPGTRARPRARVSSPEFEASTTRTLFEQAVRDGDWENAFTQWHGLSMSEMLAALDGLSRARFDELWIRRSTFLGRFNFPRMEYARSVVFNKVLPNIVPGDLRETGQVANAAAFLSAKLAPAVPKAVNPNPAANISLILQECNYYGLDDKSHIAYVLASAQHESGLGTMMTERWGPTAAQRGYEGRADLGNTQPGDGFRFRGRGFVQITGRANYTFYRDFLLTRGINADLTTDPERTTEAAIASVIIAHGMSHGRFRGPRLSGFGSDCNYDFVNARGIVNADVAKNGERIAEHARSFRNALN